MESYKQQKLKTATLTGILYFSLLGLVNFTATLFLSEIQILDIIILVVAVLPALINRRKFFLVFGLVAAFVSLYMGFACLLFHLNPKVQTSQFSFFMGYLLAAATLFASILFIYAGMYVVKEDNILAK